MLHSMRVMYESHSKSSCCLDWLSKEHSGGSTSDLVLPLYACHDALSLIRTMRVTAAANNVHRDASHFDNGIATLHSCALEVGNQTPLKLAEVICHCLLAICYQSIDIYTCEEIGAYTFLSGVMLQVDLLVPAGAVHA
jgi:hypothetical protein